MKNKNTILSLVILFILLAFLLFKIRKPGEGGLPSDTGYVPPTQIPDLLPRDLDFSQLDYDPQAIESSIESAFPLAFDSNGLSLNVFDFELNDKIDNSCIRDMREMVEAKKALQQTLLGFKESNPGPFAMSKELAKCKDLCLKVKREIFEELKKIEEVNGRNNPIEVEINREFERLQRLNEELDDIEKEFNERLQESNNEIDATDQRIARIDQIKDDLRKKIKELEHQIKKDKQTQAEDEKILQNSISVQRNKQKEVDDLRKKLTSFEIKIGENEQLNLVCVQENIIKQHVKRLMPNASLDDLPAEIEKYEKMREKHMEFEEDAREFLRLYHQYFNHIKKFHTKSECDQSIKLIEGLREDAENRKRKIDEIENDLRTIAKENKRLTGESQAIDERRDRLSYELGKLNQEFNAKDQQWVELEREKELLRKKRKEECDPLRVELLNTTKLRAGCGLGQNRI